MYIYIIYIQLDTYYITIINGWHTLPKSPFLSYSHGTKLPTSWGHDVLLENGRLLQAVRCHGVGVRAWRPGRGVPGDLNQKTWGNEHSWDLLKDHPSYKNTYSYIHVYVNVYIYIYIYIYTHTYMYVHTYVYIYNKIMYIYIYRHVFTCILRIYIYIHTYTYIRTIHRFFTLRR